jgi:hypothetical protein
LFCPLGWLMILIGLSCMFYFGAVLWCLPCRAHVGDSRCRVLQYVHDSPIVGCVSDWNTNPGKGVVVYGSKGDLILNAMVGFTLMISSSCGCLLEVQS